MSKNISERHPPSWKLQHHTIYIGIAIKVNPEDGPNKRTQNLEVRCVLTWPTGGKKHEVSIF